MIQLFHFTKGKEIEIADVSERENDAFFLAQGKVNSLFVKPVNKLGHINTFHMI